jgi:anti-sigma factor RsiW
MEVMDNRACRDYEEKLVLYHFGELGKAEAAEVAAHVLSCASCRSELDLLRDISAPGMLPARTPSHAEVQRAVQGVMEGISPARRRLGRRLIPAYIAVAAAVLAIFLTMYMPNIGGNTPQDTQMAMAQPDWEVLENLDVIGDIDVIVQMDNTGLDELGPIRD